MTENELSAQEKTYVKYKYILLIRKSKEATYYYSNHKKVWKYEKL